nr:AAA family ATPase [Allomuricauda sp.]
MVLYEREEVLQTLGDTLERTEDTGHIVLLSGNAGMGKTSVVKRFLETTPNSIPKYVGYCDDLYTPRPLGPLIDILMSKEKIIQPLEENQRDSLFLGMLDLLRERSVLVIEDVHWADDGTLDFIKFLNRRIHNTKCTVLLTFRPNEIQEASMLGLSHNVIKSVTRISLKPLSKVTVLSLCNEKGIDGQHIYDLTDGNPFFTSEYLLNTLEGIPDSINNLILSRISPLAKEEKEAISRLSLFPNPVSLRIVTKLIDNWESALMKPMELGFISIEGNLLRFRHEIVRLVIESAVPIIKKIVAHNDILETLRQDERTDIVELIHHAKGAKKFRIVAELAPKAARRARELGVHKESAFLFRAAIECTEQLEDAEWINLLEEYSFECYLTNNLDEAIEYRYKALQHIENTNKEDEERLGINYCWLSRLYWYQANGQEAIKFGKLAIKNLEHCSNQNYSAQTFSNFGQLYMLKGDFDNTMLWNRRAYNLARTIGNLDVQAHSLTNLGSIRIRDRRTSEQGFSNLRLAEELAIQTKNHDHLARIYTTLLCDRVIKRKDPSEIMEKTLDFCSKHQVESYYHYNLAWKSFYLFQKGKWEESISISQQLLGVSNQAKVNLLVAVLSKSRILMRQGNETIKELLIEIAQLAKNTGEALRTVPIATAMLEYEWLYDYTFEDRSLIHSAIEQLSSGYGTETYSGELAFWCSRVGAQHKLEVSEDDGFKPLIDGDAANAIKFWSSADFPYELALSYCLGNNEEIREGYDILERLQAVQTKKRVREHLKDSGRQTVPRGILRSTRNNPLHLTNRELDVLKEVSNGLSNSEIASTLYISSKTVDNHVSSILSKMEVSARQKAIIKAKELKII